MQAETERERYSTLRASFQVSPHTADHQLPELVWSSRPREVKWVKQSQVLLFIFLLPALRNKN